MIHGGKPVRPKTPAEIEKMRVSGRLLGEIHAKLRDFIRVGITTKDIDEYCEKLILEAGAKPNFKNYQGYPASVCVSLNDEVVHGIPSSKRYLEEGDIISLDCGLVYDGYHSDAARTWGVGRIHANAEALISDTRESFFRGAAKALDGGNLYDISNGVAASLDAKKYGIVRDLTGHGIGRALHEDPVIPNYAVRLRKGIELKAGMTLAIEPMVTLGTWKVYWEEDGWTVRTLDHAPAAHYENTVAVRSGGLPEILTLMPGEEVPDWWVD